MIFQNLAIVPCQNFAFASRRWFPTVSSCHLTHIAGKQASANTTHWLAHVVAHVAWQMPLGGKTELVHESQCFPFQSCSILHWHNMDTSERIDGERAQSFSAIGRMDSTNVFNFKETCQVAKCIIWIYLILCVHLFSQSGPSGWRLYASATNPICAGDLPNLHLRNNSGNN